jgi:hypothetical protein
MTKDEFERAVENIRHVKRPRTDADKRVMSVLAGVLSVKHVPRSERMLTTGEINEFLDDLDAVNEFLDDLNDREWEALWKVADCLSEDEIFKELK